MSGGEVVIIVVVRGGEPVTVVIKRENEMKWAEQRRTGAMIVWPKPQAFNLYLSLPRKIISLCIHIQQKLYTNGMPAIYAFCRPGLTTARAGGVSSRSTSITTPTLLE
jgi:hypothetical protein